MPNQTGRGRGGKGKGTRDLMSFFNKASSSGSANLSTHGSGIGNDLETQTGETPSIEEEAIAIQLEHDEEVQSEEDAISEGIISEFHMDHIITDPGLRIPIGQFAPNIRGEVRRAFIEKGPTQPTGHNFPKSDDKRSFQKNWFKQYDWLEYSLVEDRAYCFYCYLFRDDCLAGKFGHDTFTKKGFKQWKNALLLFRKHVGGPSSLHNQARSACVDFDNQRSSLKYKVITHSKEALVKYETRFETSLSIVSLLALQGEPFRGHDETSTSLNRGNFLEILEWYKSRNEEVRKAFDELCPKNAKMTSGTIQKELASCCAEAILRAIKEDMGDCRFSVLVDESRDISIKEQMAIVIRYVNKKGEVIERFLGVKHVKDTTSEAIKKALVEMLSDHGLDVARIRGQGYDGASNMRGEFNGVQKLIRDENQYAFYVHCFAHQLQLVVVSVTRCCLAIEDFFEYVTLIVNNICGSCKRMDVLLDKHRRILLEKLESGEISSGRGQHQETSLARPGDTK